MILRLYNTNLSYRLQVGTKRVCLYADWWYDRSSRKHLNIPLEFRVCRQSALWLKGRLKGAYDLEKNEIVWEEKG